MKTWAVLLIGMALTPASAFSDPLKPAVLRIYLLFLIKTHFRQVHQYNQEFRQMNRVLDQTNQQLKHSLKKVKKLSGLLPICATVKKSGTTPTTGISWKRI